MNMKISVLIYPALAAIVLIAAYPNILTAQSMTFGTADVESAVMDYFFKNAPSQDYEILGVAVKEDSKNQVFKYFAKDDTEKKQPVELDFSDKSAAQGEQKISFWQVYDCPPDIENMAGYAKIRLSRKGAEFKCWVNTKGQIAYGPRMAAWVLKTIPDAKFGTKIAYGSAMINLQYNLKPNYDPNTREYIFNNMGWKEIGDRKNFTVYQVRVNEDSGAVSAMKEMPFTFSAQNAFDMLFREALESIKSVHPDYQLSFINWDFDESTYRLLIDYRPETKTIDHWRLFLGVNSHNGQIVSSWHGLYLTSNHIEKQ